MRKSTYIVALLCAMVLAVATASARSQPYGQRENVQGLSLEEGLLGKNVKTQGGEEVGEIDDVIFSRRGRISHVLVGVGGFWGIGEKTVALDMNQLQFDDQGYAFFKGTRNDLENMPEVDLYAFRRPYRGYYDPAYGPYGAYGRYGYGRYGPGRDYGPYGGGSMRQRDEAYRQGQGQWQGGYPQDEYQQQYPPRGYRDSRHGWEMMRQDRGMQQGPMQRSMSGMSGDLFLGAPVFNERNDNLGDVEDLVIDPGTGRITHVAIEVGGVLGIGGKEVVVPFNQLRHAEPYSVIYRGTKEQLEQMPEYQVSEGGRVFVADLGRQQAPRAGGQGRGRSPAPEGELDYRR
jgi:sporulation protein YlmC with PRC-barrel domain